MIIADIIKELEKEPAGNLLKALYGIRDCFRVFPIELKQQMLGEYSDTEYAIMSALRSKDGPHVDHNETIFDIYRTSKV